MALGAVLLAGGLAGASAWAASHPGVYGHSHAGCITVQVPSSTGGAMAHSCGSEAQRFCASAYVREDRISLVMRPECRRAGIGPASRTSPNSLGRPLWIQQARSAPALAEQA
jgi:hypothetical protein